MDSPRDYYIDLTTDPNDIDLTDYDIPMIFPCVVYYTILYHYTIQVSSRYVPSMNPLLTH
jgi:hypothetical protein